MVKDEDQNNEIEMNNQNEDINGMNSASAEDKDKTRPSEVTEETKREKICPEESEPTNQFQGQSERSQH